MKLYVDFVHRVEAAINKEYSYRNSNGNMPNRQSQIYRNRMKRLSVKIVFLIVDDSLQVFEVDVTIYHYHRIGHFACIGDDDFAQVLAITTHKHCLLVTIAPLVGNYLLIGALLVKILEAFAILVTNVGATLAQIKQLHRSDTKARFG